jgi:predicted Zn-dependent peptidase
MMNQYKLSNGVTVVLERLPHIASASAGIWVRAGAVDENENAGISHFIEHMLFKGTKNRTYRQISEDIERLGGNINAFTGKEGTCYYVKTLSEHLFEGLAVLADMLTASLFDAVEMEKEKNVIIEEIKMIEDVPDEWGHDLITDAVFNGSTLGRRIIGTRESVGGISREALLSYIGRRYTADSIVISICGMFNPDSLREMLESLFGGIGGAAPKRVFVPGSGKTSRVSIVRDIEQMHVFLGTKGLRYEDVDIYVLDLYAAILGGGMSSRLFTSVREEKGLAYSVFSAHTPYTDDGQFVVYAGVADEKTEAVVAAMKEEILKLAEEDVDADELARVREQYKGGYIFRRESNSARMFSAGRNMLLLDRVFTEEEILAGADAVTCSDIRRMAQRFADFSAYSAVAVGGREVDLEALLSAN